MTVFLQKPGSSLKYTYEWEDEIPAGITLVSVVNTLPDGLTAVSELTDAEAMTSTVQILGTEHGKVYEIGALATLSNGELVPATATIRGFNG